MGNLQELSLKTLNNYHQKSSRDLHNRVTDYVNKPNKTDKDKADFNKVAVKRYNGKELAARKGEKKMRGEALKIGSIVIPTCGPHKGEPHEVVHIFEDNFVNILPLEVKSKYEGGRHVTSDPTLLEEVVVEEFQEPHGHWWHNAMSETARGKYRESHPESRGYKHAPGSPLFHREKSKAHNEYADWHHGRLEHHHDKYMEEQIKKKPDHELLTHHLVSKEGHAEQYYHHLMKGTHHEALSRGGTAPHPLVHANPTPFSGN